MTESGGYRERLLPSWWAWLVALSFVAMLAIAYGAALGTGPGVAVAVIGGALTCWLLWLTAPVIRVSSRGLEISGATLPLACVASAESVDAARMRELRGPGADARLFVALRPWSASDGVLVVLDDPEDPHPAWLFTSRHPGRIVAALTATMSH
ncbi:MAG: DUF3093 domain-containing protein [Actinobacteria bacterium]|nr:DUF3093 domain-containing protein [Actinomycetota bacterium]